MCVYRGTTMRAQLEQALVGLQQRGNGHTHSSHSSHSSSAAPWYRTPPRRSDVLYMLDPKGRTAAPQAAVQLPVPAGVGGKAGAGAQGLQRQDR